MGVPGYFSWIHRRFPNQVKKFRSKGPKKHIDCLYIDVNGICYQYARDEHNYNYLLNPKSVEEIYKKIVDHIDSILEAVDPQLQVYLMMDGPCPRAKMNQQRQRRFHAQINHNEVKKALINDGFDVKHETVPNNSIAPGTPFMFELNKQIRQYIETRVALSNEKFSETEEPQIPHTFNYRNVQFIISDSNYPGEGEHKILEIIRKHVNFQLTHCIVSADADLLLLSLSTIGKRLLILREQQKFKASKGEMEEELKKLHQALAREQPEEEGRRDRAYDLVDINGIKRELLAKYKLMFDNKYIKNLKYDPMRIMDDFVFLSLFAGNDFLPRQNYMQIKNDKKQQHILDRLVDVYDEYLEEATCYLSDRGYIQFNKISDFFKKVSKIEPQFKRNEIFTQKVTLEKGSSMDYLKLLNKNSSEIENITEKDINDPVVPQTEFQLFQQQSNHEEDHIMDLSDKGENSSDEWEDIPENGSDDKKDKKVEKHSNNKHHDDHNNHKKNKHHDKHHEDMEEDEEKKESPDEEGEEHDEFKKIFSDELNGKEIYLKEKLQVHSQNEYDQIIMKYLEGFQFTLEYYFRGIEKASWNYYYPHFYAPLMQDVVDFLERNPNFEIKFLKTKPYPPFKQLLCILHPENEDLLPKEFKGLFGKYLKEYCPEKFEIDKYGATMDHMQIIKLPFVDMAKLDAAYEEGEKSLQQSTSKYDKERNAMSEDVIIQYCKESSIDINVFNKRVHKYQIHGAPISITKFDHLGPILPSIIANVTVNIEKKEESRNQRIKQFEKKIKIKDQEREDACKNLIQPTHETKKGHHNKNKRDGSFDDDELIHNKSPHNHNQHNQHQDWHSHKHDQHSNNQDQNSHNHDQHSKKDHHHNNHHNKHKKEDSEDN